MKVSLEPLLRRLSYQPPFETPFEFVQTSHPSIVIGKDDFACHTTTSNPFDLISIQNEQILFNAMGPFSYLPRKDIETLAQNGPSVKDMLAGLSEDELKDLTQLELSETIESLEDAAKKAPIVRLVDAIIREAHARRASDIHLEPTQHGTSLRYRIDGVLYEQQAPPRALFPAIASRIKILAGINIAEKRLPQDGRIRMKSDESELDIRVATVPSIYGESISLRLLDKSNKMRSLTDLGLSKYDLERISILSSYPNGIILVTGPTGGGKTTTLYAMLQAIRTSERKILTLEDPVEYEIAGVTQIQVKPKIGLTFAEGLRSLLRHDPDVLLVGEIRDRETAEMAIHASLTGHLVLSSLHTNDAPGAVTRLLDMGIEEFLLASTIRAVLAQRLVRVLCHNCRKLESDGTYSSVGCEECDGTGFHGRTAIYELMVVDDQLRDEITSGTTTNTLRGLAIKAGMRTLLEDGLTKVEQGITSIAEVHRVLGKSYVGEVV
ncbi:MAG: type II/IV secretion system protein [Firmicutes bacterium]|nr:type II/IV secretion system protein [Bacillota bacterium]